METRRLRLSHVLFLASATAVAACGTPRETASTRETLPDSVARARGVLTVSGDEGGFPELPPVVPGAREAAVAIRGVLDAQVAA